VEDIDVEAKNLAASQSGGERARVRPHPSGGGRVFSSVCAPTAPRLLPWGFEWFAFVVDQLVEVPQRDRPISVRPISTPPGEDHIDVPYAGHSWSASACSNFASG
jgi:hypothetical protein